MRRKQEEESDLEDIVVEAGSLRDIEAALGKAKTLRAMLASGLPSKVCPLIENKRLSLSFPHACFYKVQLIHK